jgi:LuxR family maltose regulon positive regulatory protein
MLHHEMGEDKTAVEQLQKARAMGELTTLVDWPYRWYLAQARLKESGGELDAALLLLDKAERVYVKTLIPNTRPIEALKANVYLKQGRLELAREWVHTHRLSVDDEISYLNEFEHLTLARLLIADDQSSRSNSSIIQAINLLERLQKAAEAQKRMGNLIEILVTLSLAYQAQGNISLARATLERTLYLAQPEGYVRLFVDQGEPMRLLILELRTWIEKQASSHGRALFDYAGKLLSAFEPVEGMSSTSHPKKTELIEPLSERELEVLHLVAKGLSNTEISQRLVLAVSTVKGHNQRIFDKLQVENRTEAVMRARELGLL